MSLNNYNHDKDYNLDMWCNKLQDEVIDIYEEKYKCIQDYSLLELNKEDIMYFLDNKTFNKNIKLKIINLILNLQNKYKENYLFFRLNTRSPKDILEYNNNLEILDEDTHEIKITKKIEQLNVLKISNYQDIVNLLALSERTKNDMIDYINNSNEKDRLYLVFTKWNQILGNYIEYRCCIVNKKPTSISLFKPEYYSCYTIIPVEIILVFLYQIIKKLDYKNYVVDVYVKDNKCYLIEINPLTEETDLFTLEYDTVINSDNLIVTL